MVTSDRLVLGLAGEIGAGKDTASNYLREKYGFKVITIGDMVREEAAALGISPTRENLQKIGKEYAQSDPEFWGKHVAQKIKKEGWTAVVVNGIRRPTDFTPLQRAFGQDFVLVAIRADPKIRFERLKARKRFGDPEKWEDFCAQDRREFEYFNLGQTLAAAQYTIENNGTFEQFYAKLDRLISTLTSASERSSPEHKSL